MPIWHTVDTPIGFNAFGHIDPYIDWAFDRSPRGRAGATNTTSAKASASTGEQRHPVLLRLNPGRTVAQFAAGDIFTSCPRPQDWTEVVHVPPLYLDGDEARRPAYFVALVTPGFFNYFQGASPVAKDLLQVISRMTVSREMPPDTSPPGGAKPPVAPTAEPVGEAEEQTVVIGIIDDGIAFANSRFRTGEGRTRVEAIWLQDGEYNHAAARYGYGRSLNKGVVDGVPGIDAALAAATYSGIVDEDQVYVTLGAQHFGHRASKTFRTVGLHATHGTHVMDLACGYPPGEAPRAPGVKGEDNRPIVCVQLPAATSEGTSGASLDTYVVDAIRYILEKADEIARGRQCGRLPVVINFSYGTIAGRHDGTADIERAVDELIAARKSERAPLQVVIPTGNSRLKQCHARLSFSPPQASGSAQGAATTTQTLRWRILPDDKTRSHLEIWLPPGDRSLAGRVKIMVCPPGGTASHLILDTAGPAHVWGRTPEEGMCSIRYAYVPEPTRRGMFLITVTPTVTDGEAQDALGTPFVAAPSGVWTVTLENVALGPNDVIEAWIQRDDTRYGHLAFGRQSYFDHPDHERLGPGDTVPDKDDASLIKRAGTINPLATGQHTVVVGGYCRSNWRASDYSGEGADAPMRIAGPIVAAASDEGVAHRGILAAGTRSGSVVALRGTSAAAPLVTRKIADLMAAKLPADRHALGKLAKDEEEAETASGRRPPSPPANRTGEGRLDLPSPRRIQRIEAAG